MNKFVYWFKSYAAKLKFVSPPVDLEEMSQLDQIRHVYNSLNTEWFAKYRVSQGQSRDVVSVYKNIGEYIARINQHIAIIKKDGNVLPLLCEFETESISINSFFLTTDGYYQKELSHTLRAFRTVVLNLCQCLDEAKHADYDTKPYNTRLLTPLIYSLFDIATTLHEITVAG